MSGAFHSPNFWKVSSAWKKSSLEIQKVLARWAVTFRKQCEEASMKTAGWTHEKRRSWSCSLCWTRCRSAPFKQRSSILLLRFPAWSNLHFKPLCPFNQPLCMPSQPLQTFRAKSQTEAHKAIFDYTIAHGETLSNSTASCGEGPGDSQALNLKGTFFPECCRNRAFDPNKGSCECLSR